MSLQYNAFFAQSKARDTTLVTSTAGRNVALVVSNVDEQIPYPVLLRVTKGVVGVLNVAGAATVRTEAERQRLFTTVVGLFGGDSRVRFRLNQIAIGSGGTRILERKKPFMTALEAPGIAFAIAQKNHPNCLPRTWGHTPRTNETLGYGGLESSFLLGDKMDKDTIPNPLLHVLWILQKGASTPADWNGDLPKFMDLLQTFAGSGNGRSGLLVLSGGGVTAEEVLLALSNGIPVLGAVGTGRAADALVHLKSGELNKIEEPAVRAQYQEIARRRLNLDLVTLFDASDPRAGQLWLQEMGFGLIRK